MLALAWAAAGQGAAGHGRARRGFSLGRIDRRLVALSTWRHGEEESSESPPGRRRPAPAGASPPRQDDQARRRAHGGGGCRRGALGLVPRDLAARIPRMVLAAPPGRRFRADFEDSRAAARERGRPENGASETDPGGGSAAEADGFDWRARAGFGIQ